ATTAVRTGARDQPERCAGFFRQCARAGRQCRDSGSRRAIQRCDASPGHQQPSTTRKFQRLNLQIPAGLSSSVSTSHTSASARSPSGQCTTPRCLPARLVTAASPSTQASPALSARASPPRSSRVCAPDSSAREPSANARAAVANVSAPDSASVSRSGVPSVNLSALASTRVTASVSAVRLLHLVDGAGALALQALDQAVDAFLLDLGIHLVAVVG